MTDSGTPLGTVALASEDGNLSYLLFLLVTQTGVFTGHGGTDF